MAKTNMAKKTDDTTAPEQSALALMQSDELAGLDLGDYGVDGLAEVGAEDIRLPKKIFNLSGKKGDVTVRPDQWFDTVEETTADELDLALVDLTKSNVWEEYDEGENRNVKICRSWDRKVGVMQVARGDLREGQERPCNNCPQLRWTTDSKGKRGRSCGPVYDVLAVDRVTASPCVLRFKRTSLAPLQTHLNRHHIGKRIVNGRRSNYPLFAFQVTASLVMSDNGKFAVPVLTRGPVLPKAEIEGHAETARAWRETMLSDFRHAADAGEEHGPPADSGGDDSFDPNEFSDDAGATAEASPNRF